MDTVNYGRDAIKTSFCFWSFWRLWGWRDIGLVVGGDGFLTGFPINPQLFKLFTLTRTRMERGTVMETHQFRHTLLLWENGDGRFPVCRLD